MRRRIRKKTAAKVMPKGIPPEERARANRKKYRIVGKTNPREVERRRVANVAAYLLQAIREEEGEM